MGGNPERKGTALAMLAGNFQPGIMVHCNLFDNGKTQARAPRFARARAVHAVKALRQAGNVLGRNANA